MSLFVYFIAILTTITEAKTLVVPVSENKYLTIDDLNSIKIYGLIFIVTSLLSLIKWVWSWFSSDQRDLKTKMKELETSNALMIQKLDQIALSVARLTDSQVSEGDIRKITRDEIEYGEKLSKRRN